MIRSKAEQERRAIQRVARRITHGGGSGSSAGVMYFRAGKAYGLREVSKWRGLLAKMQDGQDALIKSLIAAEAERDRARELLQIVYEYMPGAVPKRHLQSVRAFLARAEGKP